MTTHPSVKQRTMVYFEERLRDAIMLAQDVQLAILEAGEGRISADFRFVEGVESSLVDVQQRVQRYRAEVPQAHSWFKPMPLPVGPYTVAKAQAGDDEEGGK